jgi:hypothetical protein
MLVLMKIDVVQLTELISEYGKAQQELGRQQAAYPSWVDIPQTLGAPEPLQQAHAKACQLWTQIHDFIRPGHGEK